jgi:hypothetical protein
MRPLAVSGPVNGPLAAVGYLGTWVPGGTLGPPGRVSAAGTADQGTDRAWPARSDGPTILRLLPVFGISLQLAATVGSRDGQCGPT